MYRFYHQSLKVFTVQEVTVTIVNALRHASPEGAPLNEWFMTIIGDGTGHTFTAEANDSWLATTRPIIEAYAHARYFLDQAITCAASFDEPPETLPENWAALLYLYNLRN